MPKFQNLLLIRFNILFELPLKEYSNSLNIVVSWTNPVFEVWTENDNQDKTQGCVAFKHSRNASVKKRCNKEGKIAMFPIYTGGVRRSAYCTAVFSFCLDVWPPEWIVPTQILLSDKLPRDVFILKCTELVKRLCSYFRICYVTAVICQIQVFLAINILR